MPDYDPYSIQLADEPTALEMARARAAALRGQNYAGLVGSLAHDPYAARSGAALMHEAQQGLQDLGQAPGERMRQLLQGQQLQKGQLETAGMQSPEYGTAGRALLKKFGLPVADQTPNPAVQAILPIAEKAYSADLAAQARRETARLMATGGAALSPEALEQAAQMYATTGTLPQLGAGRAGANLKTAVANKAAQLAPTANLAENKAGFKASQGSLGKLQMQADSIQSFEETALKNLDAFRDIAKQVVDVHSPLFNQPIRTVMNKLAGDPRQAQFNAARQVAIQEIGKVLGGAVSGGAISDSQRHEVESLLGPDATLAQIEAVSQTLKQDMANRKTAVANQLAEIHGRLGGKAATAPTVPAGGALDLRKKYGL